MNSSGKVVVDKLTSMGTEKEFYGTPSIEVNSGYLEIKKLNLNTDTIQPEYSEVMDPSPDCESTDHDAGSYQEITWVDYNGNNKLGMACWAIMRIWMHGPTATAALSPM